MPSSCSPPGTLENPPCCNLLRLDPLDAKAERERERETERERENKKKERDTDSEREPYEGRLFRVQVVLAGSYWKRASKLTYV